MTLAVNPWMVSAVVVTAASLAAIVLIVWAPWRAVREEPPLDESTETRLLMGQRLDLVAGAEEAEDRLDEEDDERAVEADPTGPAA